MVGPGVDHQRLGAKFRGDLGRGAVRQGQEHHVVTREVVDRGVGDDPVGQGREVLVVLEQRGARTRLRSQGSDPHLRVGKEQAQQFAAGVPGGPRDSNGDSHLHDYAALGMNIPVVTGVGAGPPQIRPANSSTPERTWSGRKGNFSR